MPYNHRELRLERMRELLARLDNPHHTFPIVHIAGTKGKGSTAAMIASILSASGHRAGLYSSPHLHRVEERVAIDGEPCTPRELAELVERVRPAVEAMDRTSGDLTDGRPTYFEITTAMALLHFACRKVDAGVIEVGLGGRLDSTNVCRPAVSVITTISYDHMKQLGGTLTLIAREKAGIIKDGVPVVSGVVDDEPRRVIDRVRRRRRSSLAQLGADFEFTYSTAARPARSRGAGSNRFCVANTGSGRGVSQPGAGATGPAPGGQCGGRAGDRAGASCTGLVDSGGGNSRGAR